MLSAKQGNYLKALHAAAPNYITDLIKRYTPGRLLRSSNQLSLICPLPESLISRLTVAGHLLSQHSVWNALEFELRSCNSLSSFKSKPKTWLIKVSYDVIL